MIKQISLPSKSDIDRQLELWEAAGPIESLQGDALKARKHIEEPYLKALAELDQAYAEGYVVKERYPFAKGEGVNLILYKDPDLPTDNARKGVISESETVHEPDTPLP